MLGYMMQKIADPRPGMTEPEHRAIVKGWITIGEGDNGQTPGGNGQTPTPPPSDNDDDHGLDRELNLSHLIWQEKKITQLACADIR